MRKKVRRSREETRDEWASTGNNGENQKWKQRKKKKKKPPTRVTRFCSNCRSKQMVTLRELNSAFTPRCNACGGVLILKKDIG
jgi:ribosomal protein S27E